MLISMGLKLGVTLDNMKDMDFVYLINLLDASLPQTKPKYRKATQKDIDLIT